MSLLLIFFYLLLNLHTRNIFLVFNLTLFSVWITLFFCMNHFIFLYESLYFCLVKHFIFLGRITLIFLLNESTLFSCMNHFIFPCMNCLFFCMNRLIFSLWITFIFLYESLYFSLWSNFIFLWCRITWFCLWTFIFYESHYFSFLNNFDFQMDTGSYQLWTSSRWWLDDSNGNMSCHSLSLTVCQRVNVSGSVVTDSVSASVVSDSRTTVCCRWCDPSGLAVTVGRGERRKTNPVKAGQHLVVRLEVSAY